MCTILFFLASRWGICSLFLVRFYMRERLCVVMLPSSFPTVLSLTFSFVIRCCMQKTSQLGSAGIGKNLFFCYRTTWHTCFIFTMERVGNNLKEWKLKIRYILTRIWCYKLYERYFLIQIMLNWAKTLMLFEGIFRLLPLLLCVQLMEIWTYPI